MNVVIVGESPVVEGILIRDCIPNVKRIEHIGSAKEVLNYTPFSVGIDNMDVGNRR